jgi:hypothetical protein
MESFGAKCTVPEAAADEEPPERVGEGESAMETDTRIKSEDEIDQESNRKMKRWSEETERKTKQDGSMVRLIP